MRGWGPQQSGVGMEMRNGGAGWGCTLGALGRYCGIEAFRALHSEGWDVGEARASQDGKGGG